MNDTIRCFAVFDDGSGLQLFAGGSFTTAAGVGTNHIAKWDGSSWSALRRGVDGPVNALAVYDDGAGAALYAGGNFLTAGGLPANKIAKWDGSTWAPLGSGTNSLVNALVVFDDGGGSALFVGGFFTVAGGGLANRMAKWDGMSWQALGSGMDAEVKVLTVYDDGSGVRLHAGGKFSTAGGLSANAIAKWDGSTWIPLGAGVNGYIHALTVFDDGGGGVLIAAGQFGTAGAVFANCIAQWNGSVWGSLGSGSNGTSGVVYALAVFDDGNGDRLFVAGNFGSAGSVQAELIAKWDGMSWSPLATGLIGYQSSARALTTYDDGGGAALFVGGYFTHAGGVPASNFATWDGAGWIAIAGGLENAVKALTVFDDGTGPALYAGGDFTSAGGNAIDRIAKWDGSSWTSLGSGMTHTVRDLVVFDDGNGDRLFAASSAQGIELAKWDGSTWTAISGLDNEVLALAVYDDGSGAQLYVGGRFMQAGGVAASLIAKWDGANWSPLGSGLTAPGLVFPYVAALTVFDDGAGAALYAGGVFKSAGGVAVSQVAKWNGATWAPLGSGMTNGVVYALTVFDDGNGTQLIAAGNFVLAGGMAANRIARWDGTTWTSLGSGMTGEGVEVLDLAVFDDGHGEQLFAGGFFEVAGGVAANGIAKWDGASWSALGRGVDSAVWALEVFDDGSGEALFAGGQFTAAFDSHDSYLAKWGCRLGLRGNFCSGDGGDQLGCTDCPCMNNAGPGTIGGCLNSAGASARLTATGDPSVSLPSGELTDLRFVISGVPAGAFCILNSGDGVAPAGMANPCFGLNSGVQAVAFDGLRCAIMNTRRHGGRSADMNGRIGMTNSPWGGEGRPSVGIAGAGGGFVAGQTRYFQVINRDDPLLGCLRALNTSQAVEIMFTP